MSVKRIKATVDAAYYLLERATESSHEATQLLRKAVREAEWGERGHRQFGKGFGGGYQGSVQTAARYFVCKWFMEPARVTSAREACSMRGDCLCASAIRELLDSQGVTLDLPGILDLDYARDFAVSA